MHLMLCVLESITHVVLKCMHGMRTKNAYTVCPVVNQGVVDTYPHSRCVYIVATIKPYLYHLL